ncbi:uncharacterized protein CEXT_676261 [Caerostris extrusa]|uniref:Uncharacterized protein n=1 Tax=Caerostris extrusa TaxID=172846 RepID=A0AAV4WNU3_CAEEX|nr:uncharacterized protein CEXT_676261 [Caerostris extrusa]
MYQAWQWGGTTAAASPTTAGYVQPAGTGQVATPQWPANYNQYAAVTPEMQQQWVAWASQAQYAYGGAMPVAGQVPTTTANPFSNYPDSQSQSTESNTQASSEKPKNSSDEGKSILYFGWTWINKKQEKFHNQLFPHVSILEIW